MAVMLIIILVDLLVVLAVMYVGSLEHHTEHVAPHQSPATVAWAAKAGLDLPPAPASEQVTGNQ